MGREGLAADCSDTVATGSRLIDTVSHSPALFSKSCRRMACRVQAETSSKVPVTCPLCGDVLFPPAPVIVPSSVCRTPGS